MWAEVPFLLHAYLHGLIDGRIKERPDVTDIENYKTADDSVAFAFPGTHRRMQLPSYYRGIALYCREDGKYYRIPADAEAGKAEAGKAEAPLGEQIDSEFWEQA